VTLQLLMKILFTACVFAGGVMVGAGLSTQAKGQPMDIDEWLSKNSHLLHRPHTHPALKWPEETRKKGI
jgi:hypothetical protein